MFYSDRTRRTALRVLQELPTDDILQIIKNAGPNASKYLMKETNASVEMDIEKERENKGTFEQAMKYARLPEEDAGRYKQQDLLGSNAFAQNKIKSSMNIDTLMSVKPGKSMGNESNVKKIEHTDMSRPANNLYNAFIAPISSDGEQPGNVTNE
jgi:hypothetical protein